MSPLGTRRGRVGVLATLVLMFGLVLFLGSMFYLLNEASVIMGDPSQGTLFKPVQNPSNDESITYNQTVAELQRRGYIVAPYTRNYDGPYTQVDYATLINEAATVKIVYKTLDADGSPVLLLEKNSKILEWRPEN